MFGWQARLPLDVMYVASGTSLGEYAIALQKQLRTAYTLVRQCLSTTHNRQKEIYNSKVHGEPHKPGDLVWLHSTVAKKGPSRKLHHQWTGPFKVVKRLSDVTYRIQHTQKSNQRKVVHFDCLKPCPSNMRFDTEVSQEKPPQQTSQSSALNTLSVKI